MNEEIEPFDAEQADKEYEELYQNNFIDQLALKFYELHPLMNFDAALACSSNTFSTFLPAFRIKSRDGDLQLSEQDIIIGTSGSHKTLPFKEGKYIILKVNEKFQNINLQLPQSWTVESINEYFSRTNDDGNYVHNPYGLMVIDEISQLMAEEKSKKHKSGIIEQIAIFSDGSLRTGYLISRDYGTPQDPVYVNVLGGMVPDCLDEIDDKFFKQGSAGRINWTFVEPKPPKSPKKERYAFEDYNSYLKSKKNLDDFVEVLAGVLQYNIDMLNAKQDIPINITREASNLLNEFKYEVTLEHFELYKNYPYKSNYQFLMRLTEMVLRQAGRYAVGRELYKYLKNKELPKDIIPISGLFITADDVKKGIHRMNISYKHLNAIIKWRTGLIYEKKSSNYIKKGKRTNQNDVIKVLMEAKNNMLNTNQICEALTIAPKTAKKRLLECLNHNPPIIKKVDTSTITTEEEKLRLRVDKNAKVWQLTEDYI